MRGKDNLRTLIQYRGEWQSHSILLDYFLLQIDPSIFNIMTPIISNNLFEVEFPRTLK